MILSLLSVLLYILSFPKFNFHWLAWIALVPLVCATAGLKPKRAFLIGWAAGTLAYAGLLYWIVITFRSAQQSFFLAVPCWLLLSAYLGLYWGAWTAWTAGKTGTSRLAFPFFAAAAWATLEYIRTYLFSGFPWTLLGDSQWRHLPLIQMASITGVYGVSFLVVLVNAAVAFFINRDVTPAKAGVQGRQRHWIPARQTAVGPSAGVVWRTASAGMTALILLGCYGFGVYRLRIFSMEATAPSLKVALLQGSIDQYQKWDSRYIQDIQHTYEELLSETARVNPDLIIWPETSVPGYLMEDPDLTNWLRGVIQRTGTHHLVGAPSRAPGGRAYNTAFSLSPRGETLGLYAKQHLVPFGEVVPLSRLLGRWIRVLNDLGGFAAGERSPVLPSSIGPIAVNICYEAIFPDLVRRGVRQGAGVIVNLTNDGWYMRTAAPHQHFIPNVFRAVENGRWVLRANNTGITGLINPAGRVVSASPVFVRDVVTGTVSPRSDLTFYTRHGDVFAWASLLFCILISLRGILRRRETGYSFRSRPPQGTPRQS
ncbi:MAG: apolipoprotein N-acyltransferase [Elusimicrobia bacterium RIFCSPLOWO2_01_FULL_59_12]|nr:MAG: apolipoprotein N-acyltransferase [Elusimicrobia bacterium RIFCSPLOWO2_01_FULL_59_12]